MKIHLQPAHFRYLMLILSCCCAIAVCAADAVMPEATQEAAATVASDAAAEAELSINAFDANIEILPNYKKVRKTSDRIDDGNVKKELEATSTSATTAEKYATEEEAVAENVLKDTSVEQNKVMPDAVRAQANIAVAARIDVNDNDKRVPDYIEDNLNINNNNHNNEHYNNNIAADDDNVQVNSEKESERKVKVKATAELVPNNDEQKKQQPVLSDNLVDKQAEQQRQREVNAHGIQSPATETHHDQGLPEIITEIPTVTVTEIPLEVVETPREASSMDARIIEGSSAEQQERVNQTVDVYANSDEVAQKDEQILQINDPGGGEPGGAVVQQPALDLSSAEVHIPTTTKTTATNETSTTTNQFEEGEQAKLNVSSLPPESGNASQQQQQQQPPAHIEEVPIPVFSEWAQKQMEAEASKQQALEQEQQLVVNNSAQRRNHTNGNGKPPQLKLRAKNYASPDCGAKIIASNTDASNTGAVLSNSRDEYMLSPCGNRIWFVVELCEAIQAQKIELANFELFSSSPRNFTVAVSNRFPTRDWSNVGRFAAEDKRNVQTFELHPHLFGKFVRVDIHSHYSKEHFCPVSLFRVFGTSEFEAFETEIRLNDDMEDLDDDEQEEQANANSADNIFKSASDAVINMVKKAAEVLVMPAHVLRRPAESLVCRTPAFAQFNCAECNNTLVERINAVLSCEFQQLSVLLNVPQLSAHLQQTRYCAEDFGIELAPVATPMRHKSQSYFLSLLPAEYAGALCKLLAERQADALRRRYANSTLLVPPKASGSIEKHIENVASPELQNDTTSCGQEAILPGDQQLPSTENGAESAGVISQKHVVFQPEITTHVPVEESTSSEQTASVESKDSLEKTPSTAPDVNIFNVHAALEPEVKVAAIEPSQPSVTSTGAQSTEETDTDTVVTATITTVPSPTTTSSSAPEATTTAPTPPAPARSEEEPNNWESIDNLLTTTVASITAGGAVVAGAGALNANALPSNSNGAANMQQKLSNGAQSESVFIRLSNRIKALERNMSLSGQYLEELSRRYKKQVEELQQTLTQQTLTVRTLEEQSRRYIEQEQVYQHHTAELSSEVRSLTLQVQACIVVIIFVGACIFLMLIFGSVYYRKLRRQTQELVLVNAVARGKPNTADQQQRSKFRRRKSYEDFPLEQSSGAAEKHRRPSEEAMLILKDCDMSTSPPTTTAATTPDAGETDAANRRQRKISVFYGSNNNINASGNVLYKRKGVKHSWHGQAQDYDKFFDIDTLSSTTVKKATTGSFHNGEHHSNQAAAAAKSHSRPSKKKLQQEQAMASALLLKRQGSAPGTLTTNHSTTTSEAPASDFDESLILDEDDLVNFLPTSDLAYNEFMPEGPSGYQIMEINGGGIAPKQSEKTSSKKFRRLSSPAFFKYPFSKNKSKSFMSSVTGAAAAAAAGANAKLKHQSSVHEPTSWEWYRLKRNEQKQQLHKSLPSSPPLQTPSTPSASLDSSSLSEINFPTNSTRNSFRILEEAILSSGELAPMACDSNGNASSSGASSSSSGSCSGVGNHRDSGGSHGSASSSTTSSTTKKKNRAFNKIFRNVF